MNVHFMELKCLTFSLAFLSIPLSLPPFLMTLGLRLRCTVPHHGKGGSVAKLSFPLVDGQGTTLGVGGGGGSVVKGRGLIRQLRLTTL
jgi:hypothetical protein